MTTTTARFDLKMDADEKAIVAKAAALMGTTMAGFVRVAAKEKAQVLLEREARITLSERDFNAFARALDSAFAPNPALKPAKARQQVAAYALIVDAKGDSAAAFYRHFGFKAFLDAKRALYLPLGR